ncbi:hypothetical protein T4D_2308 [Trichinella pseudospiralis]|uniref:Uncharacterized protein n=1 Tax=Trichinella pseudospiralis TaxID=6337 RepID=A0A0V1G4N3_TRIPS|nr:hypothetical protein T4D_2308 [Trichinella pseudospiralis]
MTIVPEYHLRYTDTLNIEIRIIQNFQPRTELVCTVPVFFLYKCQIPKAGILSISQKITDCEILEIYIL